MRKIPNVFVRDWNGNRERVLAEPEPASLWVLGGEGLPHTKRDGTACLWRDGKLWKRYDAKRGKAPPAGFVAAQEPDAVTGHHPGWLSATGPEDVWIREAQANWAMQMREGMTYEACGPKIGGNAEGLERHVLFPHDSEPWDTFQPPWTYDTIRAFLAENEMEGLVWHHPDGRMAKVKRRDFGLLWPVTPRPEKSADAKGGSL